MDHYRDMESRIERLAIEFDSKHRAQLDGLDADAKSALESRLLAFHNSLFVAVVFFKAVQEISILGQLALSIPPAVLNVGLVSGNASTGRLVAGMIATSTCTVLEDYLKTRASHRITKALLNAARATLPLPRDDAQATARLINAVRPSCRQGGSEWLAALNAVFDVVLTDDEQTALLEMIAFRNEHVHDPATAAQREVTGEALKCWVLASRLLCQRVAIS